jgi:hypothetical protein
MLMASATSERASTGAGGTGNSTTIWQFTDTAFGQHNKVSDWCRGSEERTWLGIGHGQQQPHLHGSRRRSLGEHQSRVDRFHCTLDQPRSTAQSRQAHRLRRPLRMCRLGAPGPALRPAALL